MAEGMEKTYVKDIVNKEGLKSQEAKDAVPENFDFAKFDEMVENSFQQFLQSYKENNKLTENMSKDDVQALFNNWLDTIFIQLDEIKEMEIEKSIIMPTDFELINFETAKDLLDLQTEVETQQKDETVQEEIVSVSGSDLHIHTYKDETGEKVNPDNIAELFNKNFERKDELLNLLKQGGLDNVKKFQRIIANLPENGSEDSKGINTLLGRFGIDGKFGGNTMKAFEDYISKNTTTTPTENGNPTENGEGTVQASAYVTDTPEIVDGNVVVGDDGNRIGTSEIIGDIVDLNKNSLTLDEAKKIIEQEKNSSVLKLPNLENITADIATELAKFEGKDGIILTGLKSVDENIFKAFLVGKCRYVRFRNGELFKYKEDLPDFMKDTKTLPLLHYSNNSWTGIDMNNIEEDLSYRAEEFRILVEENRYTRFYKNGGEIPVGTPVDNTPTFDIDQFEFDINKKEEIDVALATKIVQKEKEAGRKSIQLENLKKMPPEVATILARFEGELRFPALEELNPEILKAFMSEDTKCTLVKFSGGYIENNNGKFSISINDGETIDITDENIPENIYGLLVNNTQSNTQQPTSSSTTPTSSTPTTSTPTGNGNNQNQTAINGGSIQTIEGEGENPEGDETETNESIADTQIQYDADTLISGLKQGREAQSEMDALKLLLGLKMFVGISNSLSYSIEGYELKGQEKKDIKRLRSTLRLFANSHETTVTITDFFRLAAEQYSTGGNFDIGKLGKEPSHRGTKKSYQRFGELYSKYRKQEGGPYFKKVMGIMENYFLRGNVDEKSIRDLYQMENIGTWEGFIDPEKEREVLKGLFDGKDVGIDLGVPYQSSEQLKTLKNIVKKIDINELFKSGKLDGKGNNLGKREKQFYDLYQSYKKGELQGDNYYKKVFEFLVGAGRGNTTIVDAINAINLTKIAKVDFYAGNDGIDTKDEIHYNSEEEKKFILLLSDFNHDARIDGNDNGLKMGQQLRNIYKSINIDLNNAGLDDQLENGGHVWSNILSFAKQYLNNTAQDNIASKLDGISSVEELNQKIKDDPNILIALQNMLKNSSISINSICRYGDKATEMFMKELMQDQKMDEQYNKIFEGLVAQGVNPTAKQALKPIILGSLMDNSVGMGLGAAYDAGKIGSFSAVLGVADVPGVGQTAGLVVGYGNSIPAGENRSIDLGASGGVSYNAGFIPMFSVYAGASRVASNGLMRDDFDATTLTKIHGGANFTMIGTIPSRGLSAGVSMDKLAGIDKQESMLRPQITSVISEFLNDAEITGIVFGNNEINDEQKEKCINNIREKLGAKYGKMDEDLLDKAANNLYMGFVYYAAETSFANASEQEKKAIISKITNNIVNNYVTQRRNDKIEELNGKTTVSDVTVGVQFLAGYWPIPMMGVTFTKYSNLYSRETPESIAEYESILSTGQGMGYLERSVDENGNILPAAITYLNEKLSIASRYNLNEMQIQFKEITDNNEVKNIIFIPRELCNSINIFADTKMKDFIKSTEEGFEIPVNTELSLLTYTRTDATKFDLIIGDYKKEDGDITINITSKFEGDPLKYEKENGHITITPHKVNADMGSLYQDPDFPLSQCTEIKDGKFYFETRGSEIQCTGDGVNMENGKLVVSARAMLLIKRKTDGSYTAECNSYEKGFDTHITYIDEKKNGETETTQPLENLFESYNELNAIFTDIEKKLSLMDNGNKGAYAAFMNAAATENIDDVLDTSDYERAFQNLSNLLKGKLKDTCFDALRGKLDNATFEEKVMIVDRFKAIFSYNDNLVNGSNLELQLQGRGNRYKEIYGYDRNVAFPLTSNFDYRDAVKQNLKRKGTFKREPNPNLVGMTAFYRLGDKNAGRSYMMTELGGTNVLGGEMIEITDANDLRETKKWFEKNLNKSGVHKELLKTALSQKLKSILKIDNERALDDTQLIPLLKGDTIDIGHKKVKINIKYVFYLLGECANESIGIDLGADGGNNIIINDNKTTDVTIKPETSYEGVSGVYVGSAEASSRYEIGNSNSATLGFAVGKGKVTETEEHITKPDPGDDGHQTTPNDNGGNYTPGSQEDPEIVPVNPAGNQEDAEVITTGTTTNVVNNKVVTTTVTDAGDEYIVTTRKTPLPAHDHPFTASQSEGNSKK